MKAGRAVGRRWEGGGTAAEGIIGRTLARSAAAARPAYAVAASASARSRALRVLGRGLALLIADSRGVSVAHYHWRYHTHAHVHCLLWLAGGATGNIVAGPGTRVASVLRLDRPMRNRGGFGRTHPERSKAVSAQRGRAGPLGGRGVAPPLPPLHEILGDAGQVPDRNRHRELRDAGQLRGPVSSVSSREDGRMDGSAAGAAQRA